jgi:hypothetical protein
MVVVRKDDAVVGTRSLVVMPTMVVVVSDLKVSGQRKRLAVD